MSLPDTAPRLTASPPSPLLSQKKAQKRGAFKMMGHDSRHAFYQALVALNTSLPRGALLLCVLSAQEKGRG